VQNAVDGNLPTEWDTEQYEGGLAGSNKSGVGLYVTVRGRVEARELGLSTSTPGFRAAVYASDSVPPAIGGWKKVSAVERVTEPDHTFELDTRRRRFRNYLLWISELPENGKAVVKELGLKK
jgi:serine/threonine-protein kinase